MTSIHKRNTFLLALTSASVISVVLWLVPFFKHSTAVKYFHLPAIWAAFVVSGDSHMPPTLVLWITFILYGLLYCALVLVWYIVLLEITLIRRSSKHLEQLTKDEELTAVEFPAEFQLDRYVANLGVVIADIERKRRHHWLLADLDFLDLDDSPERIGAALLSRAEEHRVSRMLLKQLEKHLARQRGAEYAHTIIQQIKEHVREQTAAY